MAIPIALEALVRIVFALQFQELAHARMARLHLVTPRPAVVRQILAAAVLNRDIDQASERVRAGDETLWA